MSPTVIFLLAAALLLALVLLLLLPPLLRGARPASPDGESQRAANVRIYRDQLAELENDRAAGTLAEAEFTQARDELQHRLLEETAGSAESIAPRRHNPRLAFVLLFALPLLAAGGYAWLGQPQALDPMQTQARVDPQQIEDMLDKLKARLKANPDDLKGWVMLARSYKVLGRMADAAQAYSHGGALLDGDPVLLADYAEVLSQVNGKFDGKPTELLAAALKIDPLEPQALFLSGAAASERKDFAAVADYWGRLLPQLEAGSEEAKSLGEAVDKARAIAEGKAAAPEPAAPAPEKVSGEVTLSGKVAAQAQPDDLLFVFARAGEGSRMPLAVVRAKVADLPLSFAFDDTMALPGGQKISDLPAITIEARVAKSGQAQSVSGDLYGSVSGVKPGSGGIKVVIDQVQP